MFIRFKKNKGGSTSILLIMGERVPGKKHCVSRIIKNFGSATEASEIKRIEEEANRYKDKLLAESPKTKTLKIQTQSDLRSCSSNNIGFSDVYGAMFDRVFDSLSLAPKYLERLKSLVTMRIAEPCSKLRTAHVAENFGLKLKVDTIYKMMDQMSKEKIEEIKSIIFNQSKSLLAESNEGVDVLFYDLTTLYFETNSQDEIRDFGYSKDGKSQHVQIMLALVVTKAGLPIAYEYFPGNSYEGNTLIPVLNKLRNKYEIRRVVLVADAALMSKVNITELSELGYEYIISARLKNTTQIIKKHVLTTDGYSFIYESKNSEEEVTDRITAKVIAMAEGDSMVAYHSTARARKDSHDRLKNLEKISGYLDSSGKKKLSSKLSKSYIKITSDCKVEIDEKKLEMEEMFDGYFGIRTNISHMEAGEILHHYRGLWQIEQSFRIAKTNLEIRPIYHYSTRRIEAHLAICYMSLGLMRYVEYIIKREDEGISFENFHLLLSKMRQVKITDQEGENFYILEDPPTELIPIYKILKIRWPKKFQ